MRDGIILVGAASPDIRVGNPTYNVEQHILVAKEAAERGVKVLVFPELGLSAYTCGDLFHQSTLLHACEVALGHYMEATKGLDMISFVGVPVRIACKLYNCVAVVSHGELLGLVPKTHLPNYSEFYDVRQFTAAPDDTAEVSYCGSDVPFGTRLLFACEEMPSLVIAAEVCEDLWVNIPPSCYHAEAGATLIVNQSASDELVGKCAHRKNLVAMHSARIRGAYLYADASSGESGTDMVFSGNCLLAADGHLLAERRGFSPEPLMCCEVDLERVVAERTRVNTFDCSPKWSYTTIPFHLEEVETEITNPPHRTPFVPSDEAGRAARCSLILEIQATALAGRLQRAHADGCVLGVSGGLDSTLALIACVRAMDKLGWDRKRIVGVTMPCFGTTARTLNNAVRMSEEYGITLRTVDISRAVEVHFADIGHDASNHNTVYENAQARERTQVLMDIANQVNGLVIGTGDLSELALGWATYNGDHMSMYAINASIPKTLVRHLVAYEADVAREGGRVAVAEVLEDVLNTPVSPELLPPKDGAISQCTEGIVGPYELHDYFLFETLRYGFSPKKILRLAVASFQGVYDEATIRTWLRVFVKRFFTQQFKRSCLPDGPKVGSVCLSPRGDWRMPSDADVSEWLKEI